VYNFEVTAFEDDDEKAEMKVILEKMA